MGEMQILLQDLNNFLLMQECRNAIIAIRDLFRRSRLNRDVYKSVANLPRER